MLAFSMKLKIMMKSECEGERKKMIENDFCERADTEVQDNIYGF